ncbi:MAG: hypothetical protein KY469_09880 [Actinobacteria bacterium]|nr:hypothetical protein [Actinomycetota bacterium]
MDQTQDIVGSSIHALLRTPRFDRDGAVRDPADAEIARDLAAASPFVSRLLPVARWVGLGVPAEQALDRFARGAPNEHLEAAGVPVEEWMHFVIGVAWAADLVEYQRVGRRELVLRRGVDGDLLAHHPTAAWGAAVLQALLSDVLFVPRGTRFDDPEGCHAVPLLVFQYVFTGVGHGPRGACGRVDLDPLVAALTDEVRVRGGVGAPTDDEIVAGLRCVAALLVELGLVTWEPAPSPRIGTAHLSSLGILAWMLWTNELSEETPDFVDEFIRESGYLRADGGYLDPNAGPAPPSWN